MPRYCIFNKSTGEIEKIRTCNPDKISKYVSSVQSYIESDADQAISIVDVHDPASPIVSNRIEMPATIDKTEIINDGVDSITISNLTIPSRVKIEHGGMHYIDDGFIKFKIDFPGTYKVTCSSRIDLDKVFIVTVTEAP